MKIGKKLIVWFGLAVSSVSFSSTQKLEHQEAAYAVMVDAGSTGSRVHIYRYQMKKNQSLPVIELMASQENGELIPWRVKIKPGVSSFSQNLPGLAEYLKPLAIYAQTKLGNNQEIIRKTPLFFQATGGVRSLPVGEQTKLMRAVQKALSGYGFQKVHAEVISGNMEGVYQWLNVNYLEGRLDKPNETRGIIEMGGASMQITFLPSVPLQKSAFPVKVGSREYNLYSHSYDGFGECSAVAKWQNPHCQEKGSFDKCKESIAKHLFSRKCAFQGECGLEGAYQPPIKGQFWAIDNFHDISSIVQKPYLSSYSVEDLGRKICGKSVAQLQKIYPKREKSDLEIDCFDLAYFSLLLSGHGPRFHGLGFHKNTEKIVPANEINKTTISWTLGALLYRILTKSLAV